MNRFSCIVLAGGNGSRFGCRKQFIEYMGKPLWKHAADKCREVSDDVVVVGVDIPAGKIRQKSVYNGLEQVVNDRVVIVEAARPGVTVEQIMRIGVEDFPSMSYAVDSVDTILFDHVHLNREKTVQLQVPQAFNTKLLLDAHHVSKDAAYTSDTEMMFNIYGIKPALLQGGRNLMKITYPEDICFLGCLL